MTFFNTMSLWRACSLAMNRIPIVHAQNEEASQLKPNDLINLSVHREAEGKGPSLALLPGDT